MPMAHPQCPFSDLGRQLPLFRDKDKVRVTQPTLVGTRLEAPWAVSCARGRSGEDFLFHVGGLKRTWGVLELSNRDWAWVVVGCGGSWGKRKDELAWGKATAGAGAAGRAPPRPSCSWLFLVLSSRAGS